MKTLPCIAIVFSGLACAWGQDALKDVGQDSSEDLAKKLANPVASLISLPVQFNYDDGYGPTGDGSIWRANIQPVIPFSLNDDWNLISRTILPVIEQNDLPTPGSDEFGLGDTLQSFFFSPKKPVNGWIVGGGPAFLLPTATDDALGSEQWAAGPTFVALKQSGPWTTGLLSNHLASFAGESSRNDVNVTLIQPFVSYITKTKTTFGFNAESTYDWDSEQWAIPLNLTVSQLLKIGNQPVQIGAGIRYWADAPRNGPDDWGFRITLTWLFPK